MIELVFFGLGLNFKIVMLLNSFDLVLVLGGFSLGVVVLVVMGLVVVVIGLDIGGLIWVFVVWNGLVGFKLMIDVVGV